MNKQQANEVVELISAIWPTLERMSDASIVEWSAALSALDYETSKDALRSLKESLRFPPSWAEFIEEYRELISMAPPVVSGPRPADDFPMSPRVAARAMAYVKECMGDIRQIERKVQHVHKGQPFGWETCLICGLHDHDDDGRHLPSALCQRCVDLGNVIYAEVYERFYDPSWKIRYEGAKPGSVDRASYKCPRCRDRRFVGDPKDRHRWMPCESCHPGYQRWVEGHYEPNHHCAECSKQVRRRTKVSK